MSTSPSAGTLASLTSRTWDRSRRPGPTQSPFLQRLLSNDVSKLADGAAQYSVLCSEDGGVLDDLFTYRLGPERFLTVTNAANHQRDLAWLSEHASGFDVKLADRRHDFAMLAIQGPRARALVASVTEGDLPARMTTAMRRVAGAAQVLVCGTGYTGEDGVELLLAPEQAGEVWNKLVRAGARPAGLAARDTLRLEACFHLYATCSREWRRPAIASTRAAGCARPVTTATSGGRRRRAAC